MIDDVFDLFHKDRKEFRDSILEGINLDDQHSLMSITPKILKLPFNMQLYFILSICDCYSLLEKNKTGDNIQKFISQKEFKNHRDVLLTIIKNERNIREITKETGKLPDVDEKIKEIEKEFNIKIKNNY